MALEFGYDQADKVRELFEQAGKFTRIRILKDHQNISRVVTAVRG